MDQVYHSNQLSATESVRSSVSQLFIRNFESNKERDKTTHIQFCCQVFRRPRQGPQWLILSSIIYTLHVLLSGILKTGDGKTMGFLFKPLYGNPSSPRALHKTIETYFRNEGYPLVLLLPFFWHSRSRLYETVVQGMFTLERTWAWICVTVNLCDVPGCLRSKRLEGRQGVKDWESWVAEWIAKKLLRTSLAL